LIVRPRDLQRRRRLRRQQPLRRRWLLSLPPSSRCRARSRTTTPTARPRPVPLLSRARRPAFSQAAESLRHRRRADPLSPRQRRPRPV